MPQERPNHYGHLLRTPHQIAADQEFFAKARAQSPKFPSMTDALERRRRLRETIAARFSLAAIVAGLIYGIGWSSFGYGIAGLSLVGFAVTCIVAGNRQYNRGK